MQSSVLYIWIALPLLEGQRASCATLQAQSRSDCADFWSGRADWSGRANCWSGYADCWSGQTDTLVVIGLVTSMATLATTLPTSLRINLAAISKKRE